MSNTIYLPLGEQEQLIDYRGQQESLMRGCVAILGQGLLSMVTLPWILQSSQLSIVTCGYQNFSIGRL
jgi:hypothetical protein